MNNINMHDIKNITKKNIIIGVSGSIAAYKIPQLIRYLRQYGANVRVIMTNTAQIFITPTTLEIISGNPVILDFMNHHSEYTIKHIQLAKWADLIVLAPASANLISRLTIGMANDVLTTICLASKAKIVIVPAMNKEMYLAKVTQKNILILKKRNILFWGPEIGTQACGDYGYGKMLEPILIIKNINNIFQNNLKDMINLNLIVTAGPTHEQIDLVRFITNHSSGKMGFSIAKAAASRGANVTLITGPVKLKTPKLITKRINVISALNMYEEVHKIINKQDIFISCAAVTDYRPKIANKKKIKTSKTNISFELIKNPDIVKSVAKLTKNRPYVVGFAAEAKNIKIFAKNKLIQKKLDLICANNISLKDRGFNSKNNELYLLWKDKEDYLPYMNKFKLSHYLLNKIIEDYEKKNKN